MAQHELYLCGLGAAIPPRLIDNPAFSAMTGIDPEWIVQKSGVRCRYLSPSAEAAQRLAGLAARQALHDARARPEDVALVVVASSCHGGCAPVFRAHTLRRELELSQAHAIDVTTPGTAFFEALALAAALLGEDDGRVALVVGAEAFTAAGALRDRRGSYMYSEGAGAMVLGRTDGFAKIFPPQRGRCDEALPAASSVLSQDRPGGGAIAEVPQAGLPAGTGSFAAGMAPILLTQVLTREAQAIGTRLALWSSDGADAWLGCVVEILRTHRPEVFDPPQPNIAVRRADSTLVICEAYADLAQHLTTASRASFAEGTMLLVVLGVRAAITSPATAQLSGRVVEEATAILRNNVRHYDTVFRLGGHPDFAVLLRHITADDAQRLGARLARLLDDVDPAGELEVAATFHCVAIRSSEECDPAIGEIQRFLGA